MSTTAAELYQHNQFQTRRQVFKFPGAAFHLRTMDGRLLACSKQKAFKLTEDIQADRVLDWSAACRVSDSKTGETIELLRRKGWPSMIRDAREILDSEGNLRGRVIEDSGWKALVRRPVDYASLLLPQTFLIQVDNPTVATMRQNRNVWRPGSSWTSARASKDSGRDLWRWRR